MRAVLALSQGPSTPLAEFHTLKQRQKGAGKALCPTARKLLTLSFVMLKQDVDSWDLDDPLDNRNLRARSAFIGVLQRQCSRLFVETSSYE
jgi:hypothetical protein